MKIEILVCDCKDCRHWEIVRDLETGKVHLHCKTCERRDELDSFTVHQKPGSKMKWVSAEKE